MHHRLSATKVLVSTITVSLLAGPCFAASAVSSAPANKVDPTTQARKLFKEGKYEHAATLFQQVTSDKQNAKTFEQQSEIFVLLARALVGQQKYQEAINAFEKAMALTFVADSPASLRDEIQKELIQAQAKAGGGPVPQNFRSFVNNHASYYSHREFQMQDSAEEEHLRQAAISFAKERYGVGSVSYLSKRVDYAQFLAHQARPDDVAKEAEIIATTFRSLPPTIQADAVHRVLELAQALVDAKYPYQADSVADGLTKAIASGNVKGSEPASKVNQLAAAFDRQNNNELAQKYYAAALTAYEKQAPADDPALAKMRLSLAQFYKKSGKNGAALELLEMAAATHSKNLSAVNTETLNALVAMTELYAVTGNKIKAKESGEKLVEALNLSSEQVSVPLKSFIETAELLAVRGDVDTSERLYTAAVAAMKKHIDRYNSYDNERQLRNLALTYANLGLPDKVEKLFDIQIKSRENAFGQPTSSMVTAYMDKARFYLEQDSLEKAGLAADEAMALQKKFPAAIEQFPEASRLFQDKRDYSHALKFAQAWVDNANDGQTHQGGSLMGQKARIAMLHHLLGDNAQAAKMFRELAASAIESMPGRGAQAKPALTKAFEQLIAAEKFQSVAELITATSQGSQYQHLGDHLNRIANVMAPLHMSAEAAELLEMTLEMQSQKYGPSSVQAASTMRQYSYVLNDLGNTDKAREMERAERAIYALYNKQNQTASGGTRIYNPFAPLSETLKNEEAQRTNSSQPGNDFGFRNIRVPR